MWKTNNSYHRISWRGINWKTGTESHTLLFMQQITNTNLLYSTGSSTPYSVMACTVKEPKNKWTHVYVGFPGPSLVKDSPAKQETQVQSLVWGDSPGEGNGQPLQQSCLGNFKGRAARWATIHGVTKSQTQLSSSTTTTYAHV